MAAALPHQIFSLDVAALSDRLDVTQQELLTALNTSGSQAAKSSLVDKEHENPTSHSYTVCLVVSQPTSLQTLANGSPTSVLQLTLERLFQNPHCSRIVVCTTETSLYPHVVEIVRDCKRHAASGRRVPRIDVLQRDDSDVSAVHHACMYVEATAPSLSSSMMASRPLVVIRVATRVFENQTIDELAHQLRNAAILTDGLTRAVVLVDERETKNETLSHNSSHTPVGIWVCSGDARRMLADSNSDELSGPEEQDEVDDTKNRKDQKEKDDAIHTWLSHVLGVLHCESVIATNEFNWEHVVATTGDLDESTLVYRFPKADDLYTQSNDVEIDDDEDDLVMEEDVGSSTIGAIEDSSALSEIQAALDHDGISASLFPIRTKMSYECEAPPPSVEEPKTCRVPTECTPLLRGSTSSSDRFRSVSERTVLSEIDLEGSRHAFSYSYPKPNSQAFLIQVERRRSSASSVDLSIDDDDITPPTTTELVLALPDDLQNILDDGDEGTDENGNGKVTSRGTAHRDDGLPSDITHMTLEALISEPSPPKSGASASKPNATTTSNRRVSVILHIQKQVPLVGYLILIAALFAVSSQGAVLNLLVGVPPLLKLFWRVSGVSLVLLPFASMSMYRKGIPRLPRQKKLLALCCVASYAVYNSTFLVALSLTSIGHVYIFAHSHSIIMVAGKLLMRQPLATLELTGAALGFSGGVVTTLDHGSTPTQDATATGGKLVIGPSTQGDLIAFAGAFAGVSYLLCAKKLRAALGVRVFLFLLTSGVALLLLPVLILERERLGIELWQPTHKHAGLVGWVHHLDIEAYIVLVGSVVGTMGFIASMKYFEPLVISVVMLTEPVVATAISIFVGVEQVPGLPTFVGGAIVIVGCLMVLLASHKTSTKIDVSDRLVRTPFTSAVNVLRRDETMTAAAAATSGHHQARRVSVVKVTPPNDASNNSSSSHYGSNY